MHVQSLHRCVGHTALAPKGREGRCQAGPKGPKPAVRDREIECRKEIESKTDDLSNTSCLFLPPLSQIGTSSSSGVGSLFVSQPSLIEAVPPHGASSVDPQLFSVERTKSIERLGFLIRGVSDQQQQGGKSFCFPTESN